MRERGVWDAERSQAALNVFGGAAFSIGSLLFLDSALVRLGVALFVLGSFAMLLGAVAVWQERYAPRRGRRLADPAAAYLAPPMGAVPAGPVPAGPVPAGPAAAGPAADVADGGRNDALADPGLTSPAAPDSSPGSRPGG